MPKLSSIIAFVAGLTVCGATPLQTHHILNSRAIGVVPKKTEDPSNKNVLVPFIANPNNEDPEAFERDATATRPFNQVQIVAPNGLCLDNSDQSLGDNRFNLVPILLKPCQAKPGIGQLWDVQTAGKHLEGNGVALIVSSVTQHCVDSRPPAFNDKIKPSLFACGGRAAGDGRVGVTQLFFFDTAKVQKTGKSILGFKDRAPNNTPGAGVQCLSATGDRLTITTCNSLTDTQFEFSFKAPGGKIDTPPPATVDPPTKNDNGNANANNNNQNNQNADVGATGSVVPKKAEDPSNKNVLVPFSANANNEDKNAFARDNTATRAFTQTQIVAPNGLCLDNSDQSLGDFRFNLVPILLKPCQAKPGIGQLWDVQTAGKHVDGKDQAIIVSSVTQHCIDSRVGGFQDKIKPSLFSCGGRADGDGVVGVTQLFFFDSAAVQKSGKSILGFKDRSPNNTPGAGVQCLSASGDRLTITTCNSLTDTQLEFTFKAPGQAATNLKSDAAGAAAAPAKNDNAGGAADAQQQDEKKTLVEKIDKAEALLEQALKLLENA
ncbi:hypothetical protein HDU97_004562 [Phlyctochytrium planicorne]|nr:hypothetical protein HDU97_004562 [Phlyctochytrium planicorne]